MEIVTIDQPFEAQACHIRSRPQTIAPVPVDPRAVNIKSEGRSEKTKKRPIKPVIDDIATVDWTFKTCEVGTIASSATAGSSNESVPGKNRLPAIPCACAE